MLTGFRFCDMMKSSRSFLQKGIKDMTSRNAYPRPELVRKNWTNLCGEWEFSFDFGKSGRARGFAKAEKFDQIIHVPFCPESPLSGIGYKDFILACWYRKVVTLDYCENERVLLNFEAAYHTTEVFVNGESVGVHRGGYTPFSFDITEKAVRGENVITVCCEGDARDTTQPSGKQCERYTSYGCMYTRTTGIFAPVWLEVVPKTHLTGIKMTPDTDNSKLLCELDFSARGEKTVTLTASLNGESVGTATGKTTLLSLQTAIGLDTLSLWSPETPTLYDLEITVSDGETTDAVRSYFGMRKIELDDACLKINGRRVFQRLVLDQGYNPWGVYTAPNDEFFAEEIKRSMRFGFNGARLHERVFERRFLYEADRLGYLVWGEYPNWGFDHTSQKSLKYYLPEWVEAVARDYNHPALIGWCPFNETWDRSGRQQDDDLLRQIYYETKRLDKMRPVIDTSGNYHVVTDIYDIHDYNQSVEAYERRYSDEYFATEGPFENMAKRQSYGGQPYFISEYGGIRWTKDNTREKTATSWGYGDSPKSLDEFVTRFTGLTAVLMASPHICGLCYTQLTDVEQEQNGLYFYDRTSKFDDETIGKLATTLRAQAEIEKE